MMKTLQLLPGRDRSVARHHPWIFSGALQTVTEEVAPGETVAVADAKGRVLGYGSYSPVSQIRVRMLTFDAKTVPDASLIAARVGEAIGRRAAFFVHNDTNALRLVNAENDGLPGVIADDYDGWVVCQFTSAGGEYWKRTIAEALLKSVPGCRGVSERIDLKDREKEGLASKTADGWCHLLGEEPPSLVEITEGACRFLVDVRHGHKTGFYLDQRDARQLVGSLSNGADVLNCFCYTGGFGLFARACGAMRVTQVDISEEALALAKKNEALGHFCGTQMDYVAADVFQYLRSCRDAGKTFELIVLDPPKFASVKHQVVKAARGYKDINLLAMKLLKPNGILATFSCSGAMTTELFDKVLSEAAIDAKRDFQIVSRTRAGADHPVSLAFPEGSYLKGVVLRSV